MGWADSTEPGDDQAEAPVVGDDLTDSDYDRRRRRARDRSRGTRRATQPGRPGAAGADDPAVHETAREIVLRQLAASAKSRRQLEDRLADRDIPEAVARRVLDRFEEVDLVDDQAFARSYVRHRAQTRKLARSALRQELRRRGVDREIVEEAVAQRTDDEERVDALALVRRRLPPPASLERDLGDPVARQKLIRRLVAALARRGYAPGLALEAVRAVLDEASGSTGAPVEASSDDLPDEALDGEPW